MKGGDTSGDTSPAQPGCTEGAKRRCSDALMSPAWTHRARCLQPLSCETARGGGGSEGAGGSPGPGISGVRT
ncbi:unnamed protein product [Arctogadus glacialis]